MSKCDTHVDLLSVMDSHKRQENKILGWDISSIDVDSKNLKLLDRIAVGLLKTFRNKKHPINEKTLDKAIIKMMGKKDDRIIVATKIKALLDANPDLADIFDNEVMLSVTRMEKTAGVQVRRVGKGAVVDLNTVPIRVLRHLYHFLNDVVKHGKGETIGQGIIGRTQVQFTTPRKMAQKEATGAIFNIRKKVRDFAANQANQIARFIGKEFKDKHKVADPDNPTRKKLRDYGYDDIMTEVKAIASDIAFSGSRLSPADKKSIMIDMFTRYLSRDDYGNRRLKFDKKGNMVVATSYTATEDKWQEDKVDRKYTYGDYIPYTEVYKDKSLILTPELAKKFEREGIRFDELHNNLWETLKEEFALAHKALYNELHSLFEQDGIRWKDEEVEALFFQEAPENYEKFHELTPEQQHKVKYLHENATRYNVLKPFVFNARSNEDGDGKGRKSFPITYEQMRFSMMWDDMIAKYEGLVRDADAKMSDKELDPLTRHRLSMAKSAYVSILKRANYIRDRKDDYPVDMSTGTMLGLAADSKHMDHISNEFNILEQRTDEGAYYSYLQHSFAMLERNKLTTELIKSFKKADSQAVEDYIINMYKVALYQPDTKSGFLWLNYDSDSISRAFGRANISISPAKIDRKMRQLLSYTSGNLLRGYGTAIQNFTAIIQKNIDMGVDRVLEAYQIFSQDSESVKKLISLSGVVDFREFFSRALTNDARNLGGSRRTVMHMTAEMLKYWKAVGKIPKSVKGAALARRKHALKKKLEKDLGIAINSIPSEERLTKRQKIQKDEMRTAVLRKYVDFAINKQYEADPWVKNVVYQKGASIVEIYSSFVQAHLPTMGKTESTLRALSFIIGVRAAMDKNYIPKKDFSQLTPDELAQAIEIGREYTEMLDFGMSRQDMGQVGHSNVGAFFTQFKVWSFQKMSKDIDTVKKAYEELKDVDAEWFDFKAGLQLFAALAPFRNQKAMRTASPHVAAFRSWIYTQGIWTAIWDFAIMGPLIAVPGIRQIAYKMPGIRAIGGSTSDLISLLLMVPGLALALSAGEGDDEWDKILDYYSRRTIFGMGARWGIEALLAVAALMQQADAEETAKRLYRSISPLFPPGVKEAQQAVDAKKILEDVLE
tara:strand:+ start:525 stop:3872 length:3348 start_codon:yes stop_codon:yes gene_type:complete